MYFVFMFFYDRLMLTTTTANDYEFLVLCINAGI